MSAFSVSKKTWSFGPFSHPLCCLLLSVCVDQYLQLVYRYCTKPARTGLTLMGAMKSWLLLSGARSCMFAGRCSETVAPSWDREGFIRDRFSPLNESSVLKTTTMKKT